jgi:hypothetical protein
MAGEEFRGRKYPWAWVSQQVDPHIHWVYFGVGLMFPWLWISFQF